MSKGICQERDGIESKQERTKNYKKKGTLTASAALP
jgi:hypothetical protein